MIALSFFSVQHILQRSFISTFEPQFLYAVFRFGQRGEGGGSRASCAAGCKLSGGGYRADRIQTVVRFLIFRIRSIFILRKTEAELPWYRAALLNEFGFALSK